MRATQTHLRQTQTRAHPGGEQNRKTDYNRAAEILFYLRRPVGSAVKNHRIKHLAPANSKRINPVAVKCEDWKCRYLERAKVFANICNEKLALNRHLERLNAVKSNMEYIRILGFIFFYDILYHLESRSFAGFFSLQSHSQCRRWHQEKRA